MVRIRADLPNTSVWRDVLRPKASSPRIITQTCNGAVRRRSFRREASRAVHRPSACSGIKALRNTSDAASRQALLPFRSLDPFRALREPDRRRPDEERLSRSEQRTGNKPKHDLTGKAPYRFESTSLQRGVWCEPDFRGRIPSMTVEFPPSARTLTANLRVIPTRLGRRAGEGSGLMMRSRLDIIWCKAGRGAHARSTYWVDFYGSAPF